MVKLASWNVNGLRAVMKKGELVAFLEAERPDILCLQEVKIKESQVDFDIPGYCLILNSADRPGYSGTGMLIANKLANDLDLQESVKRNLPTDIMQRFGMADDSFGNPNCEGRVLVLELSDFYLATVYTPNSKGDLSRLSLREKQWDPAFLGYMKQLQTKKPVVFCGDLNVAARPIDLANPKQNVGKHGFTDEERRGFANYLADNFADSFRLIHGDVPDKYTWWTHWARARERNVGWRIDYYMVDERLRDRVTAADIYPDQMGSDHCPIGVTIE